MELNKLTGFVMILVLTAMLVGVGVLVLDKFGDAARDSTVVAYGAQNVTLAGGVGNLTFDHVTALNSIGNATNNHTIGTVANLSDPLRGIISVAYPGVANGTYFVGYTYDKSNAAVTGLNSARNATGTIASDWIAIIVVVGVLAFVLFLVMRSFAGRSSR